MQMITPGCVVFCWVLSADQKMSELAYPYVVLANYVVLATLQLGASRLYLWSGNSKADNGLLMYKDLEREFDSL